MAKETKSTTNPAPKQETALVELRRLNLGILQIPIRGVSSLISHAWSDKAKAEMLAKQQKKAATKKSDKDPFRDYVESMYWMDGIPAGKVTPKHVAKARFGFPSVGFKNAGVSAARQLDGIPMTQLRGAFHVRGELTEIETPKPPEVREDMVRLQGKTADIRYRGEFRDWSATLEIEYNKDVISPEMLFNLYNVAGFAVGIGEWRPEKNGQSGRFEVLMPEAA